MHLVGFTIEIKSQFGGRPLAQLIQNQVSNYELLKVYSVENCRCVMDVKVHEKEFTFVILFYCRLSLYALYFDMYMS
jgi:hypothetical protein